MPIFWVQRSTERFGTVPNGSERFRRPQVCTVKSSCSWFFQVPVSKPSKKPPCGSKDQGYKSKESEKKQKRLLRDLDVAPGGWGPYCKALSRQGRGMLNTREKVKLDVEFKRLEVSQLFVHGRLGPFQNPACLENCSVESFLSSIIQRNFQPFELHIQLNLLSRVKHPSALSAQGLAVWAPATRSHIQITEKPLLLFLGLFALVSLVLSVLNI